ncbi:Serine/threonine-protein kinase/endoribonuclease IRE2 [Colletotrichum tanaceti]|uniref:Serine/threonine-protein kinase/endoribonuclease IRE1 n=1 Tax=Colletotrichum tanaceti TaxID=1306861 RepID=A0A4U6XIR7_9PEZI|nr:Serine/threonine-protein kinase/endoribonuclease IRE1 [Colletotrichum tanaceti]KAJ0168384.1 Serine/threonine-protein kinase/endoribonuclease IRE2 [Colletotrichum tanaceti]TKW55379.1 Serine/threonine-protein kinase/endoribonuclease IRE1 [Colletotrichum tanaceti]
MASLPSETETDSQSTQAPKLTSLQDLTLVEAWDPKTNAPKYVTFYHITDEAELWFGQSYKNKRELTLDEYRDALERVPDDEIYPEIPTDTELTIAPDDIDCPVYIKRPGLNCYETMKGTPYVPKAVLDEALMLEKISKTQHPNIVKYYGCQTKRGRITCIVLKEYDCTLTQYVRRPDFQQLDKARFLEALDSAVAYVHSLGLAHNDINPHNIMVGEDGLPVLLDFGSCAPYGQRLQSLGSEGWYEKLFFTSEKEHDDFSLNKMKVWIQNPEGA